MSLEKEIKNFYDKIQFPGKYTLQEINYYVTYMDNPYMKFIHDNISGYKDIIDLGCGTGAVTNFLSIANPNKKFLGIDFSKAVDFADSFAKNNKIKNVSYTQEDIFKFNSIKTYDVVICQGVLHHIPKFDVAIDKIKKLVNSDGIIILGVYHPLGSFVKTFVKLNYKDQVLKQDQIHNPYETYFTKKEVLKLFKEFDLVSQYPKTTFNVLMKSKSTGLVVYVLKRK